MKFSEMFQLFKLEENQLQFALVLVFLAGYAVRIEEIGLTVVSHHFKHGLVGAGGVFILHIQNGIDPVFPHQRAKAVFDSKAGKQGGIVGRRLPVEVKLCGPPGANSVLQLKRRSRIAIAAVGGPQSRLGFQFQFSRLFQIMGVGDEIGFVLSLSGWGKAEEKQDKMPESRPDDGQIAVRRQDRWPSVGK